MYTTYGENEKKIIREGTTAIREVLMGNDIDQKKSLLFALDWFMDPFFKQDISRIYDDLMEILQEVVILSEDADVSEDALSLLSSYAWPPFGTLEKNLDKVSERIKPYVLYAINMDILNRPCVPLPNEGKEKE